jgi:hypothetical protein
MNGSPSSPNDDGVESFQTLDALVLDGCGVDRALEQSALAPVVTRILIGRGWQGPEAERTVQGLNVKELWALLRERRATASENS